MAISINETLVVLDDFIREFGIRKDSVTLTGRFALDIMTKHLHQSDHDPILGLPDRLFAALGHLPSEEETPEGLFWHNEHHVLKFGERNLWLVPIQPINAIQVPVGERNYQGQLIEYQLAWILARWPVLVDNPRPEVVSYYKRLMYVYEQTHRPSQTLALAGHWLQSSSWYDLTDTARHHTLTWLFGFGTEKVTQEVMERFLPKDLT